MRIRSLYAVAITYVLTACSSGATIVAPGPPASPFPPPTTPVASLALSSVAVVGDLGPRVASVPLTVKGPSGKISLGTFANPVTVAVSSGAPHTLLSIDGGVTKASSVQVVNSGVVPHLQTYYDGAGGPGYTATFSASATGVSAASSALNTMWSTAVVGFGNMPTYVAGAAAFSAPAQQLQVTLHETNFAGTFSVVSSTCGGVASVAQSGATFAVTTQAFGTCVLTLSDGVDPYPVSVTSNLTQSTIVVPQPSGATQEYTDPTTGLTPTAMTVGSDGNLWFVGATATTGYLARVTPSGTITDFPLAHSDPVGIATGSDGNLWVIDGAANTVTKVATNGSASTSYASGNGPTAIAPGPDGALWIADGASGQVTCLTTAGAATTFTVPNAAALAGIAAGSDGGVWVTDEVAPLVARIAAPCVPSAGAVREFPVPATSGNAGVVSGPDGALWFTQLFTGSNGAIGRLSTSGLYTSYADSDTSPGGAMTRGPDNDLWFAGCSCGIGKVTPGGTFSAFSSGISGGPSGIVAGPDGGIWYVSASGGNAIVGRVQP